MIVDSPHPVPQSTDAIPQKSVAVPTTRPRRRKKASATSMRESTRITALISTPHNMGAIDRRWQIAVAIQLGLATPWRMRKAIDADVKRAIRYVKRHERGDATFPGELTDIHCAWTLRYQAKLLTRSILEARLLAGQSIAETAMACSLSVGVVRVYESLFFAVRDKLQHRIYILGKAIGPRYWTGSTEDDIDILLKSLAYLRGPLFLDYVLPYFTTPWSIPDRLDALTGPELQKLQTLVQIRSLVGAMSMSPQQALKEYARRTAEEPATQWALLATEFQPLIDAAAEQIRLISAASSLSPTTINRLLESYRVGISTPGSCNKAPAAVALAG